MQINENQKPVSKDLRNTLNWDLLWTSKNNIERRKALCSRVSIFLWEDLQSPLFWRISIGEDKREITMQTIEDALTKSSFLWKVSKDKIEELGTINISNLDQAFENLKEYLLLGLTYFRDNLNEEWLKSDSDIVMNRWIYGLVMILADILQYIKFLNIIDVHKAPIKTIFSEVKTYLDPLIFFIKEMDDDTKTILKNSYWANGYRKYWRTYQKAIRDTHSLFNPEGLDDFIKSEEKENNERAFSIIRDIEEFLKKDFLWPTLPDY